MFCSNRFVLIYEPFRGILHFLLYLPFILYFDCEAGGDDKRLHCAVTRNFLPSLARRGVLNYNVGPAISSDISCSNFHLLFVVLLLTSITNKFGELFFSWYPSEHSEGLYTSGKTSVLLSSSITLPKILPLIKKSPGRSTAFNLQLTRKYGQESGTIFINFHAIRP